MVTKYPLFILIATTFSVLNLKAQNDEWTRTAKPGYDVYAPITLANGIYGVTLSERALDGNYFQMNGIFDYFPEKGNENAIQGLDFNRLELIVMKPKDAQTITADFIKGKIFSRTELSELEEWQQNFDVK